MTAGCTATEGAGDKGYVSGDGQVTVLDPGERGDPVPLAGTTLDGTPFDVARLRGRVVVVNVWWSGCAPCIKEAPLLVEAAGDTADQADFVGVNIRDASTVQAVSFNDTYGIDYPSVYSPDSRALLGFPARLVRSVPSTAVLDRQGRLAAAVLGELPSAHTLVALIEDVAEESAGATR